MYRHYGENGLEVFLVNLREKSAEVAEFIKNHNYRSTVLLDKEGEVAKKFHVMGIPTSMLLDKNGNIVFRSNGTVNWKSGKVEAIVNDLLDEK